MHITQAALEEALTPLSALDARCLCQGTKTGVCLSAPPFTVNRTYLGSQQWRDALFLCYDIDPPDPPTNYDSCGAGLSISNALGFNKGVLLTTCHNELHDGVTDLARKVFTPS